MVLGRHPKFSHWMHAGTNFCCSTCCSADSAERGCPTLLSRASSAPLKLESGEACGTLRSSTKKTCHREKSTPGRPISADSALMSEPPDSTRVNAPRSCTAHATPQHALHDRCSITHCTAELRLCSAAVTWAKATSREIP